MELRHLELFVAVAEEGSFTRAAKRVGMVQSGVSASIKGLERELGIDLLERTTHRVALTVAGEAFLPEARATLAAAAGARDAIDQVRGVLRGKLRVGTMQAQAMYAMGVSVAELIAAFRQAHPAVEIQLRHPAGGSGTTARDLRDGRVDLGFVGLPQGSYPGIDLLLLASEPIQFTCSRDHPLAAARSVELQQLAGEPFVDFPRGWAVRMTLDRAFAAAGVERRTAYEVNDVASALDFVEHGLAVSVMPPSFGRGAENLRFVPLRRHATPFRVSLAIPSGRPLSPAARALIEEIETAVASRNRA
jgi:DNA-binding transcriptional LysR family regulator